MTVKSLVNGSLLLLILLLAGRSGVFAQSGARYADQAAGMSADDLVRAAIRSNGELEAMRKEAAAAEQMIRQAGFRANPSLEVGGTREIGGMGDNSQMVQTGIPLELGGRRGARIRVAQRELAIRQKAVEERERQLAAEVRTTFGEALAAISKLLFMEEMLSMSEQNYELTSAKVQEGRTPPLERNQELVELNRLRAEREMAESAVETRMFELRNLAAMKPEEPLRLKGTLETPVDQLPSLADATAAALKDRPDLQGAAAVEALASARIEQARSEGRLDADAMIGYERAKTGFPQLGVDMSTGVLTPIENRMNVFTFGVKFTLPVRDRKQGEIAAIRLEQEAAQARRNFGELTIRREVAAAFARYERAVKAREIIRVGVRDQAQANTDVVRQTYELGSKTLMDYIAEHHRYIETENTFINAKLEAYLARVELLKAVNSPELYAK